MTQQSLLFSASFDLQGTRQMSSSGSSPDQYHTTPSPVGWWSYQNSAFAAQQSQLGSCPALVYRHSPMQSPYTQLPQIHADLAMLPDSPSYSPLQSRAQDLFPPQNPGLLAERKDWSCRVEPQVYEASSVHTSPGWPIISAEPFDSNSWEMIMSALEAGTAPSPASSQYTLPSPSGLRYLLPCPSPSPTTSSSGRLSPLSSPGSSTSPSRRASVDATPKTCSHCSATTTPLWRRDPVTHKPLCNACGLYLQQRNKMRPAALIAADQRDDDAEDSVDANTPECSHCHTRRTSVWRRSKTGQKLCNACGVYVRLRGRDRPLSLRRNKIRPRCKHPK